MCKNSVLIGVLSIVLSIASFAFAYRESVQLDANCKCRGGVCPCEQQHRDDAARPAPYKPRRTGEATPGADAIKPRDM